MLRKLMLFAIALALVSGATALYLKSGMSQKKKSAVQLTSNEAFRQFCRTAVTSANAFGQFKRDPVYNLFYENTTYEEGQTLASIIKTRSPQLLSADLLDKFRRNDSLGSPRTFSFEDIGNFSPTTLRYIKVSSDLERHLGSLNGLKIIEIGGGYGGQCKVLFDLFKIEHYTIVDMPEALELAKKYLKEMGVTKVRFLTPQEVAQEDYDLVLSNYGFTESSAALQSHYFDSILRKAKMGYLTCNFFAKHFRVRPWTKEGLLKKLSSLPVQMQVLPEEPQTGQDNFVVLWK